MNPPAVNLKILMEVLRGAAREAQAEHVQLERLTEIIATQPSVGEGYTPDAAIVEAVKRLPGICSPWSPSWPPWSLRLKKVSVGEEGQRGTSSGYDYDVHGKHSIHLNLHQVTVDYFYFSQLVSSSFQSTIAMTWAYEDCDRPLKVSEKQAEFTKQIKERVLEEEGKGKRSRPSWRPRELS